MVISMEAVLFTPSKAAAIAEVHESRHNLLKRIQILNMKSLKAWRSFLSLDSKIGLVAPFRKLDGGVLQELLLFHIFNTDLDKGIEGALRKCTGDTKLSGANDTPEGWDDIQKEPGQAWDGLECQEV